MDYDAELRRRIRHEKKLQKLGSVDPTCALCGFREVPSLLEAHHIAGRANSDLTTFLCRNCHGLVSDAQEDLAPDLRRADPNRSPLLRLSAFAQGMSIMFILLAIALLGWAAWCAAASVHVDAKLGTDWWKAVPAEVPS